MVFTMKHAGLAALRVIRYKAPFFPETPQREQLLLVFKQVNAFVFENIKTFEMIGVLMRIVSFTLVSWMGPESPFLFVWIFNTIDAIMLSWCSVLKKDPAYTLLNAFWIMVGLVGIARATQFIH